MKKVQFYTFKKTSKYHGCRGWIYHKQKDGAYRMVLTELSDSIVKDLETAISISDRSQKQKDMLLNMLATKRATKVKGVEKKELVKVKEEK